MNVFLKTLNLDLTNLTKITFDFRLGQPFRPFEQLLAVLPPESAKFLPEPYRVLMTEPSSPLRDFYPTDIAIDRNGKKNDWEYILLINFIDQDKLLFVSRLIPSSALTPHENERNQFGTAWSYIYNVNNPLILCKTPFRATQLPDFQTHVSENVFSNPPGQKLGFKLLPNTRWGVRAPPGFPSLHHLKFKTSLLRAVNVFGPESRYLK